MATIRRNKYGKIMHASMITGTLVTGFTTDEAAAKHVTDDEARAIVEAYKARGSANAGRIEALDAKGKVLASAGDPGEPPAPPKPVASLPGLAERVEKLEERVEMIEQADSEMIGKRIESDRQFTDEEVKTLKALLAKPPLPVVSITEDEKKEIEALLAKSKTGQWVSVPEGHQLKLEPIDPKASDPKAIDPKASKGQAGTGGGQKSPTAPVVPAG